MHINTSTTPENDVSTALSKELQAHKNTDILLLLAGGSALDILDELDTAYINEYVTVMMMDERFSKNPLENNFLQMTSTAFYTTAASQGAVFIPSVPNEDESQKIFAARMEEALTTYITKKPAATIIALFGIGPDGHTAGIFPMDRESFIDTYGQGELYVPVIYDKNPSPLRSSITPKFIQKYISKSFVYATGASKRPILSTIAQPYELHEMPAHIHEIIDSALYTDLTL